MKTRIAVIRSVFAVGALVASLPATGGAQEPSATPAAKIERVAAGIYRLGEITIDKPAREIRFPAVVNQTKGAVEYLLVGKGGKTHESVLRTDAEPIQVQTAMLLLGLGAVPAAKVQAPPSAIDASYLATAPLPEGKAVTLLLRWKDGNGDTVERKAETAIMDDRTHAPMTAGTWLYNGSYIAEGRFQAQAEKSFAALVTDPTALINNPRPGHDNDTIWSVAAAQLPAAETPVEFIIQLPAVTP